MKITQTTVKAIARAYGFSAKFTPEYGEWRIASKVYPSDSYFTTDSEDAIGTMLTMYRAYRSYNQLPPMKG